MPPIHHKNFAVRVHTVYAPALALLGLIGFLQGCPAKTGCVNCHISDVMASPDQPNARPNSAINVQLGGSGGETVTAVEVTIANKAGERETHRYEGEAVRGINATSPTSIPDPELYDINGQPPVTGTIEITLSRGPKIEDSLGIEAERTKR